MVVLWIAMLALKDKDHVVRASVPGLAARAKISPALCDQYLERLMGPDKYSQSQAFEGRRIEAVEGGWRILNGQYYQDLLAKEQRNAAQAATQRRYRANKANGKRIRGTPTGTHVQGPASAEYDL